MFIADLSQAVGSYGAIGSDADFELSVVAVTMAESLNLVIAATSDRRQLRSETENVALLLETRKAVSNFFDVPMSRISRDIHLINDRQVDKLEPAFQFCVVSSVIASQQVEPRLFGFSMAGLETIDELTDAIRRVLDGLGDATDTRES